MGGVVATVDDEGHDDIVDETLVVDVENGCDDDVPVPVLVCGDIEDDGYDVDVAALALVVKCCCQSSYRLEQNYCLVVEDICFLVLVHLC